MDNSRLLYLLHKQSQAACTPDELQELDDWYHHLNSTEPRLDEIEDGELAQQMLQQFHSRIKMVPISVRKMPSLRTKYWWAAAAVLLLLLTGSIFLLNNRTPAPQQQQFVVVQPTAPASFVRQITLSDGTRVTLKPNSTLQYPTPFTGNTRTVVLKGEAYFDVAHNPAKPFIIHTGKVTTTVLGTAFNITAWPQQSSVTVTVTRGKVRVNNGSQTLALLTANQQLSYDVNTAALQQKNKVEPVTGWLNGGLNFTEQPMSVIIPQLANRFQQPISFNNPALQNCTVTVSFDGTETLEQMLDVLCLTINATYQPHNDGYLLTGEGCK